MSNKSTLPHSQPNTIADDIKNLIAENDIKPMLIISNQEATIDAGEGRKITLPNSGGMTYIVIAVPVPFGDDPVFSTLNTNTN